MKIACWSVGKAHEPYVKPGIEEFSKRLNRYFKTEWVLLPVPKQAAMLSEMDLRKKEADMILDWLQKDDYLVLLDEKGTSLSSPELAQFLQQRANESHKQMVFLIGGAYGFSEEVYSAATGKIRLSKMTFSHQMVRMIFFEQLYRSMTILKGEPYHHE